MNELTRESLKNKPTRKQCTKSKGKSVGVKGEENSTQTGWAVNSIYIFRAV